ncbi:MAG: hypothetical protein EA412_04395 [Chitinophagaceae bacterium]|nr:MAG: hypothetical protein EA412_04395 [Chitinophagaceae bacterium]
MKNFSILLLLLSVLFLSCQKDDEDDLPTTGTPIELSGTQDVPLTLDNRFQSATAYDYYVSGTWNLDAAVTIEPGVRIRMNASARINVRSGGSLAAVGTSDLPIVFDGEAPTPGYWDYIRFDNSNNPNNKLIHTIIRNGGGNSANAGNAAVFLQGNSQLVMQHSEVTNSARYGIRIRQVDGRLNDFSNNKIDNCQLHPISLASLRQVSGIDGSNNFVGNNTYNSIEVGGSSIDVPFTVKNTVGPINLKGTTNMSAALTIEPGTTILMGPSARLNISSSGSISMIGNPDNIITVTGEQEAKGYWDYIRIDNSNNPSNEFQYVDISYGGGNSANAGNANVHINGSGFLKMGNSTVSNSARYGLRVRNNDGVYEDLGNNTFFGNELGDVELP